jgi:hypothetical protein
MSDRHLDRTTVAVALVLLIAVAIGLTVISRYVL